MVDLWVTFSQPMYSSKADSHHSGEVSQLTMTHPSPFDEQHWSMSHFLQIRDHGQHHIGTFLVDDREPTEPLSQSELMTALHMINNGMERSRSASDIPVRAHHSRLWTCMTHNV